MSGESHEATTAEAPALAARTRLRELMEAAPMGADELMFNLGLFVRSSLLVKFVLLADIYRRIQSLPGAVVEFGCWRGQNLVLLENLRAMFEPFNKQRRIIGFDTFEGYAADAAMGEGALDAYHGYAAGGGYPGFLEELLRTHERMNAFGHIQAGHELVKGDVRETAPAYFAERPETLVAFAFFDMGPFEATLAALKAIQPCLMPGSLLLFDELTWAGAPGEARAFKAVFAGRPYAIEKCALYPSKSIVTAL